MMRSWKRYVTALLMNLAMVLAVLLIKGFDLRIYYVDAFGVGGAVSVFLGLLAWVASAGAFDTIGYGFSALRSDRRDKSLYEYTVRKNEKRSRQGKPYVAFIVVGILFLLISFLIPPGA